MNASLDHLGIALGRGVLARIVKDSAVRADRNWLSAERFRNSPGVQ